MKSSALVRAVWAMAFVLPVAAAAGPGAASACGTMVYRETDTSAKLVARAEQSLSEGRNRSAALGAVKAFPALAIIKPGRLPLADRALRIMALASVRSDGGIAPTGAPATADADRSADLAWSIGVLRTLNDGRANNPSFQTDLGEALARVPAHHAEALAMLGALADKDLLTTAEGYAALARLRAEAGDGAARDAALKRCEAMTKTPQVCTAPAAVAAPAVAAAPASPSGGQT